MPQPRRVTEPAQPERPVAVPRHRPPSPQVALLLRRPLAHGQDLPPPPTPRLPLPAVAWTVGSVGGGAHSAAEGRPCEAIDNDRCFRERELSMAVPTALQRLCRFPRDVVGWLRARGGGVGAALRAAVLAREPAPEVAGVARQPAVARQGPAGGPGVPRRIRSTRTWPLRHCGNILAG